MEKEIQILLEDMHAKAKKYLVDLGIHLENDNTFELSSKKMPLKKNYAFLEILGEFELSLFIVYDLKLLHKISQSFLKEASRDDDKNEIYESVATEFLNIIACGSMESYHHFDMSNISSPTYIESSEDMKFHKNAKYLNVGIQTNHGNLLLQCIYISEKG